MEIKQRIYLNLILIAVVALLISFLAIPLLVNKIKAASSDLIQKRETLSISQKKQGDVSRLAEDLDSMKSKITRINSSFVDSERFLDFIMALESTAKQVDVQYEIRAAEQTATSQEAGDKNKKTSFQVSLWGSFPNILRFLQVLENMPYFTEINTIQIQRASQAKEEKKMEVGDVTAILNVRVYTR